jgi:hypothetical protein
MNQYIAGQTIELDKTFYAANAAYEPDTVELLVKAPLTGLVTYTYGSDATISMDTDNNFSASLDLDAVGHWSYVWSSDDATNGHVETGDEFQVEPSPTMLIKDLK